MAIKMTKIVIISDSDILEVPMKCQVKRGMRHEKKASKAEIVPLFPNNQKIFSSLAFAKELSFYRGID